MEKVKEWLDKHEEEFRKNIEKSKNNNINWDQEKRKIKNFKEQLCEEYNTQNKKKLASNCK